VHPTTAHALVAVERRLQPHAIGVVGGASSASPGLRLKAVATAQALEQDGGNYSLGLGRSTSPTCRASA
jgi:type IV secretion system protein VirB1